MFFRRSLLILSWLFIANFMSHLSGATTNEIGQKEVLLASGLTGVHFKRDILAITDDENERSFVHEALDLPFHHMGFRVQHHDSQDPLPKDPKDYRAILMWSIDGEHSQAAEIIQFLSEAVDQGVKVLLLGQLPCQVDKKSGNYMGKTFTDFIKKIGFKQGKYTLKNPTLLSAEIHDQQMIDFEHQFVFRGLQFPQIENNSVQNKVLLSIKEKTPANRRCDLISIGPFGGVALTPAVYHNKKDSALKRWVLNPFKFIRDSLELNEPYPIPDITTWNGQRAIYCHVDGDAFSGVCRFEKKMLCSEALFDLAIKPYRYPHTLSLVHVWFDPKVQELFIDTIEDAKVVKQTKVAIQPRERENWIKVARRMFAEGWVEAGLHGYCHPLDWEERENALSVKGVPFSLDDEIFKAQENFSAIMNGRKAVIYQWTGNCKPTEEALKKVAALGILNINGGDTLFDQTFDSIHHVAPFYKQVGPYIQVYTSASNENIYTNLWQGPFYGFRNVIETFKRTNSPRRLAPVNVYYHWYSGEMAASVQATREVFEWCDTQPLVPIKTSDHVKNVLGFISAEFNQTPRGWNIQGRKDLRTLRFESEPRIPTVGSHTNVLGFSREGEVLYVHLKNDASAKIEWTSQPDQARLEKATCIVEDWILSTTDLSLKAWGWRPSVVTFKDLKVSIASTPNIKVQQEGNTTTLSWTPQGEESLSLPCQSL